MLKGLLKSALRPVNMYFVRKTSVSTSLFILSTVPGLGRPRASRRCENELYVSRNMLTSAKSRREGGRVFRVLISAMAGKETAWGPLDVGANSLFWTDTASIKGAREGEA